VGLGPVETGVRIRSRTAMGVALREAGGLVGSQAWRFSREHYVPWGVRGGETIVRKKYASGRVRRWAAVPMEARLRSRESATEVRFVRRKRWQLGCRSYAGHAAGGIWRSGPQRVGGGDARDAGFRSISREQHTRSRSPTSSTPAVSHGGGSATVILPRCAARRKRGGSVRRCTLEQVWGVGFCRTRSWTQEASQ